MAWGGTGRRPGQYSSPRLSLLTPASWRGGTHCEAPTPSTWPAPSRSGPISCCSRSGTSDCEPRSRRPTSGLAREKSRSRIRERDGSGASSPVDVTAAVDVYDLHRASVFNDAVDNAVVTPPRRVQAGKLCTEGLAYPSRTDGKGPEDELDAGRRDLLRQARVARWAAALLQQRCRAGRSAPAEVIAPADDATAVRDIAAAGVAGVSSVDPVLSSDGSLALMSVTPAMTAVDDTSSGGVTTVGGVSEPSGLSGRLARASGRARRQPQDASPAIPE